MSAIWNFAVEFIAVDIPAGLRGYGVLWPIEFVSPVILQGRCHKDRSGFDGPWTANPLIFDNSYFT